MHRFLKKIMKREDGNVAVLMAAGLTGMLMMAGLVIDGGHLFMSKSHLQKTANAAALSGAQEIVTSETATDTVVNEILESHDETRSLISSVIKDNRRLEVELEKDVPLFFANLFGIDYVPVRADAAAGLLPMGKAKGVAPLGVDESVDLVYGETYDLKVDAGDSIRGNYGVLALEGPGAKLYEDNLKYGFDEQLQVGDVVNTQSGNIAGPTRKGVEHRINNCRDSDFTAPARDCERVMLIVVYEPHDVTNKLNSVQITGFAYFYITEPMDKKDDSIKGIFIKRAGSGSTVEHSVDRGAYAISLME